MNKKKTSIVWFRNDLRLHDNEALVDACSNNDDIVPVYIFDTRLFFNQTKFGFRKTGLFRTKFILESILTLKQNLISRGSDLLIRTGITEDILFELASTLKSSYIYCNRERTQEELDVQNAVEKKLWSIGQEVRFYRGKMLFYTADLPFPITHCPDQFSGFRKEVEKFVSIREPLETPCQISSPQKTELDYGYVPNWEFFEFEKSNFHEQCIKGGEDEGIKIMHDFLSSTEGILKYAESKDLYDHNAGASKLSAYLSQGCLSPKQLYHEIIKRTELKISNKSVRKFIGELFWRDHYRFMAKKHGNMIFKINGVHDEKRLYKFNMNNDLFEKWSRGETGERLVDANMHQLNETGYLSQRGRVIVAKYLINKLKLNWIKGAEYFESMLVDYDPCSNYGNWGHLANVGLEIDHSGPPNFTLISKKK